MGLIQWKDKQGRAWSFRLNIADTKRLKDAGFDIGDPQSFQKMLSSALTCVELITEALRPQWTQANLTALQFEELITEDVGTLEAVQACFIEGLRDFFLRLGESAMAKIVEKARKATQASKAAMAARADSQALDSLIQKALEKEESDFRKALAAEEAKLSGKTLPSAAGSLEATQTPGPFESLPQQ